MGRSLPWAKPPTQAHAAPPRPPKARVQLQQAAVPLATDLDRPKKQRRIEREDRTPSTSPPPAPPVEEFMRDGFDHDDIYMMVEDEFYSVAQTFTQHLHHAEYVRLKNLTKSKGTSTLSSESRPTDSITKMREELKRKKQAELQAENHKQALKKLGGEAAKRRVKLSGAEGDDSELDEDDLWAGTTLKGLMTSPSRTKTSLMGLQGHKSHTRAAAGYLPPRASGTGHKVAFDMSTATNGQDANSEVTASDDDDDLDAPVQKSQGLPVVKSIERDPSSLTTSRARATASRPPQNLLPTTHAMEYKAISPSSESESDKGPALPTLAIGRISRPLKRRAPAKPGKSDAEAGRKTQSNVNEIPIFLV